MFDQQNIDTDTTSLFRRVAEEHSPFTGHAFIFVDKLVLFGQKDCKIFFVDVTNRVHSVVFNELEEACESLQDVAKKIKSGARFIILNDATIDRI